MILQKKKESGNEKTYKHKQICGIVPGLGGWHKFVYAFFGSFLMACKHFPALSMPALQRGAAWADERLLDALQASGSLSPKMAASICTL